MKYIPWKHYREFVKDLKKIYQATNLDIAEHQLTELEKMGKKISCGNPELEK